MSTAFTTLISADQLRTLLDSGDPVIVLDTSFDLADTAEGERSWREGHVAGSLYLHLERDLSGPKTDSDGVFRGRHPLPERRVFAQTLGRCGVTPDTQVIALDRQGGMFAARLWWMLRWMGHPVVAVLDGGVAAWTRAGGALVTTPAPTAVAAAAAPPYPEVAPGVQTIDANALASQLGRTTVLDARAPERFRGDVEPLDRAAGHIPGALNRFFKLNLDVDGHFKPAAQLRDDFTSLLGLQAPEELVHQCGSGVTACHNLLAMEHAGLTGSVLYPGSWSEWSADPARPVAQGG